MALGHGKGRGSLMFIICIIIMGQYREICLREISIVSAMSGPLPECETCRTTKRWELCCKVGCTEHLDVCPPDDQQVYGKTGKDSDEPDVWDVSCALEKQELVSVKWRGWEAVLQSQDPRT